jgi:hypothetical protein
MTTTAQLETKRPVVFCGENPGLRLFVAGQEEAAVVVSYWYCLESAAGPGRAVVVWQGAGQAGPEGQLLRGVYTDNEPMARLLNETFTRYFQEFEGVPVADLPVVLAEIRHCWDGRRYEVDCEAGGLRVTVFWERVLDRFLLNWPGFEAGERRFDLSTVICPCENGGVMVGEAALAGAVRVERGGDRPRSTAFLAFCETWVGV